MPKTAEPWSLTSLREKLVKIGAKVTSHGRYVTFQLAEVTVPRQMFAEILSRIARLRAPPAPRMSGGVIVRQAARGEVCRRAPKSALCSALMPSISSFNRAFARGERQLPLLNAINGAILAAKPLESGECRSNCVAEPVAERENRTNTKNAATRATHSREG